MADPSETVERLFALAMGEGSSEEERRTAALTGVRLAKKHGLKYGITRSGGSELVRILAARLGTVATELAVIQAIEKLQRQAGAAASPRGDGFTRPRSAPDFFSQWDEVFRGWGISPPNSTREAQKEARRAREVNEAQQVRETAEASRAVEEEARIRRAEEAAKRDGRDGPPPQPGLRGIWGKASMPCRCSGCGKSIPPYSKIFIELPFKDRVWCDGH